MELLLRALRQPVWTNFIFSKCRQTVGAVFDPANPGDDRGRWRHIES
jgi:hypothetical protein